MLADHYVDVAPTGTCLSTIDVEALREAVDQQDVSYLFAFARQVLAALDGEPGTDDAWACPHGVPWVHAHCCPPEGNE
jgi:hypothetical protein